MLVAKESVLRKLPVALNKRQLRMLVGIRYAIEMYDVSFQNIVSLLKQAEPQKVQQQTPVV